MFSEDDLLPISALQHLLFCERQCALIHLERLWAENRLTREGRHLHERADRGRREARGELRTTRALLLRSLRLGLFGKADVVEFRTGGDAGAVTAPAETPIAETPAAGTPAAGTPAAGTPAAGTPGAAGTPYPVEYKRGKPKKDGSDRVQLCAQALCLEEMLGLAVPAGALFYGRTRRRVEVAFDGDLRRLTLATIERLHAMVASGRTPPAVREPKCDRCSLLHLCLPEAMGPRRSASAYLRRAVGQILVAGPTGD